MGRCGEDSSGGITCGSAPQLKVPYPTSKYLLAAAAKIDRAVNAGLIHALGILSHRCARSEEWLGQASKASLCP